MWYHCHITRLFSSFGGEYGTSQDGIQRESAELRESDAHTRGRTGKRRRRGGEGSCRGPVEVNRGPLMTSGTLYRPGRPRISLRPLSSPSVPHHLYRGAPTE